MTNYNESDWIPASAVRDEFHPPQLAQWILMCICQTSLSQVNYCVDDSYLTPQISCADPVSFPPTPASARPRSSSGFYAQDMEIYNRPRSRSAGMYTPHVNDFDYSPNPLGIKQDGVEDMNFPGVPYINPPVPMRSAATYQPSISIPEVSVTSSRLAPIPIAPNPAGLQKINTLKRGRGDESPPDSTIKRRRRSSVNTYNLELSDEERLLLRLKDEVNLPWKDIALRFQLELGKNHQVPALQMRYKRLRERLRAWTEADVSLDGFVRVDTFIDNVAGGRTPASS